MMSPKQEPNTPWAVRCRQHGKVVLTKTQYDAQMNRPNAFWSCPRCGEDADFDDEHHDDWYDQHEEALIKP